MNRKEIIEHKLRVLNPQFLEVVDVSAAHIGHSGNPTKGGQTHFELKISSNTLDNCIKIEQHRIINTLLKEEFVNGLHALSIKIIQK